MSRETWLRRQPFAATTICQRPSPHYPRSFRMPFLQLTLTIGEADPAPYEDALLAAGATSITLARRR